MHLLSDQVSIVCSQLEIQLQKLYLQHFLNVPVLHDILTIPNSTTTIFYCAFYNCSGFTNLHKLGYSLRLIEDDAFCNCYGFNIIYYIGERQPSIGSNSFYNIFPQFNSSFIKN